MAVDLDVDFVYDLVDARSPLSLAHMQRLSLVKNSQPTTQFYLVYYSDDLSPADLVYYSADLFRTFIF